jgi:chromosome segregation ATPase
MTPDQLTRLTLLLSMTALTGSENKELTFLKSIATPAELAEATPEADDDGEEEEEEEEEQEDPPKSDPKSSKPGFLDHATALGSSKASLVRRNSELSAQVGRLTSQSQQLTKTIGENATTIAGLQTELATLKGELTEAKAKVTTISTKVSEELAGLGVKDKDLPAPSKDEKGAGPASEDEVKSALDAASSFEEKAAILEAWENRKSA